MKGLLFIFAALPAAGQYVPMAFNAGATSGPAYVQSTTTGLAGSASTMALTGVVAGHALYVELDDGDGSSLTLTATDSQGNSFTTVKSANLATDGDTIALACALAGSNGSDTITLKENGVTTAMEGAVFEVVNSTCTTDATPVSSNTTSATACTSGSITTVTANDMLVGFCGVAQLQSAFAAGAGWSHGINAGTGASTLNLLAELKVAASTGNYTATSGTVTSTEQTTIEAAFQPPGGGGTCAVQADQQTGTNNEDNYLGESSGFTYGAFSFTAASSYTLCAITLPLKKVGSPTFTQNAYIYSVSGTTPGSLVGSGSANFSVSGLSGSYGSATFTGLNASIVSGTTYWAVVVSSGAPNDFTNYVDWGGTGAGCGVYFAASANGSTWTDQNPCVQGIITTYHH